MTTNKDLKFNMLTSQQFGLQFLSSKEDQPEEDQLDAECPICKFHLLEKPSLIAYHDCEQSATAKGTSSEKPIHAYHFECITGWWVHLKDCPACRLPVANIDEVFNSAINLSVASEDEQWQVARYKILPYLTKMQRAFEATKQCATDSLYLISYNLVILVAVVALKILLSTGYELIKGQ